MASIVVLELDPKVAYSLAATLRNHFSVQIPLSPAEIHETVARNRPEAVVLDIEHVRLTEVASLRRNFPDLPIVCIHRVPDEAMWIAALAAGASDVCPAGDGENVLASIQRILTLGRHAAA